jgi:KaiC/GvpD/RAD55 family RecA-like ATPase
LKPIFPQKGTAVLAGKPDTGKSQLARQLCIQVALGEKTFLDFKLSQVHNRAIYVATEDNQEATTFLMSKQFKGLDRDVVENLRFIFAETMEQKEILKKLDSELKLCPADLVVVDSFGDIFLGDDANKNIAMRKTVKSFDEIAKKHNCLILFVHHINKVAYKQSPSQEQIQGGSGLVQKVRLAIILSEGNGNERYFTVVKGNYCPKEIKENSLKLEFSEETFLFTNTGYSKPTSELGSKSNTLRKKERSYEKEETAVLILSDIPMSHTNFIIKYCDITSKSEATAKRNLSELVESGFIEKYQASYRLKGAVDDVNNDEVTS